MHIYIYISLFRSPSRLLASEWTTPQHSRIHCRPFAVGPWRNFSSDACTVWLHWRVNLQIHFVSNVSEIPWIQKTACRKNGPWCDQYCLDTYKLSNQFVNIYQKFMLDTYRETILRYNCFRAWKASSGVPQALKCIWLINIALCYRNKMDDILKLLILI